MPTEDEILPSGTHAIRRHQVTLPEEALDGSLPKAVSLLKGIQDQARRYLEAEYGLNVWYRAPATFDACEKWIWSIANNEPDLAEQCMAQIEAHYARQRD